MTGNESAILLGPFIGEFYWECGRFAPLLPHLKYKVMKNQNIKYIVYTREDRFDLYGKHADILVPLKIEGDYKNLQPNCFRLNGFTGKEYQNLIKVFKKQYSKRFKIIKHLYPAIDKRQFANKNQFRKDQLLFRYSPRNENHILIDEMLGSDTKPIVLLAPRFRKGFRRNWGKWEEFYDLIYNDNNIINKFTFVICGNNGEYIPDSKNRFHDIGKIKTGKNSSRAGLLLSLMSRACLVCGSQSAIPNIALLYKVEVLEFGCQKSLHTVTYNIHKSPITFISDGKYNINSSDLFNKMKALLKKHEGESNEKRMA